MYVQVIMDFTSFIMNISFDKYTMKLNVNVNTDLRYASNINTDYESRLVLEKFVVYFKKIIIFYTYCIFNFRYSRKII